MYNEEYKCTRHMWYVFKKGDYTILFRAGVREKALSYALKLAANYKETTYVLVKWDPCMNYMNAVSEITDHGIEIKEL